MKEQDIAFRVCSEAKFDHACRWYGIQPYHKRRRMSSTEERILAHAVTAGIELPPIKARFLCP